ncbi:unnamed protein product [Rhizoctonia solani]|uniref:Uncharacterized protein n=1 Tax=Rhizoctonia solani TaxID=456999 RepID=A0A8H3CTJ2_9AGAM|nr:unnamed protein product [Rhizoctonia solani]
MSLADESQLKNCQPGASNAHVSSERTTLIEKISAAITAILRELVDAVKKFKCPARLDFADTESPMILPNTEGNKPFISQLRKLNGLRIRLSQILTHGYEILVKKYNATCAAIENALQRMKEYQTKLHEKFVKAKQEADEALSNDVTLKQAPQKQNTSSAFTKTSTQLNSGKNVKHIHQSFSLATGFVGLQRSFPPVKFITPWNNLDICSKSSGVY